MAGRKPGRVRKRLSATQYYGFRTQGRLRTTARRQISQLARQVEDHWRMGQDGATPTLYLERLCWELLEEPDFQEYPAVWPRSPGYRHFTPRRLA